MRDGRLNRPWAAYAGFLVFGGFWGVWGAAIPAVRTQAGVSDGELGTALLFVGAGALPAMLLAGRAVDRWGTRVTAALLVVLGLAGVLVATAARDLASLCVALALVGAASGASDVAINAGAGAAERAHARPVLTRAHGVFSASVVGASLATGRLLGAGAALPVVFVGLAVVAAAVAAAIAATGRGAEVRGAEGRAVAAPGVAVPADDLDGWSWSRATLAPLVVIGGLGALAFAVENAHQSWSAVYLVDVLEAGPALGSGGPAVFAGVVAVTRFSVGALPGLSPRLLLVTGGLVAAVGTGIVAVSPTPAVALVGFGLGAAGTAVLLPTLLGLVGTVAPDRRRGTATSVVTTLAYLGFLAGPVYVGLWAEAVSLPGAMLAVAALAGGLAVAAQVAVGRVTARPAPRGPARPRAAAPDPARAAPGPVPEAERATRPRRPGAP